MNASIVLVLLLVLHSKVDCMTKNGNKTCSQLTSVSQIIRQTLILKNPAKGHNLKICQSNLTCCSKQMENELYMESSRVLKDSVHQQTNATHHFLKTQASLFDGYFKNLLKTARVKWHNMLLLTYKDIYVRNRHIFDDFFSALDNYYVYGDVDLDQFCNIFFQRIQSTMFVLLDKNLANEREFLNCTSKHIDDIKPFGRYQGQITNQLRTSLMQARAFVVGLQTGSNLTASIINYLSRNECREGFTKIRHCSLCEGIPNALACNATCQHLIQSCFVLDPLFATYWNDYTRGLYVLSSGLDGQYDIEAVIGQLAYAISSAIMEFQSDFLRVYGKAKVLCPSSSRKKRAVDQSGSDLYLEGERVRRSQDFISLSSAKTTTNGQQRPTLDRFTTPFRKQLIDIQDTWRDLPQKICDGQTFVSRDRNESCWNGIQIQKNSEKVPKLKLGSADGNSEGLIVKELLRLRQIVVNTGGTVNTDDENASGDLSGSGGESGSGDVLSGSGDPDTSALPDVTTNNKTVVSTVSTNILTDPITGSDTSTNVPVSSSTDQISGSGTGGDYVTTPKSVLSNPTDDEDMPADGSGTSTVDYVTTPKSLVNKPSIDDEDMEISGSGAGENETFADVTKTDGKILSVPTKDTNTLVKAILGTKDVDNKSAGVTKMKAFSYFSLLFAILVGFMNL